MASSSSNDSGTQSGISGQAVADMSKYEKMLGNALAQCGSRTASLKYPWEMDMYKGIFGDAMEETLKIAPFQPASMPGPSQPPLKKSRVEREATASLFEGVISQLKNETFEEETARRIAKVTEKWLTIISGNYEAFEVGSVIAKEYLKVPKFQNSRKILQATFGLKSPATLEKRANAMIRFMIWHNKHKSGFAYPVSREEAWEYVNHLKDTAAGATSASGFLEAIRFCQHVLGMRDVEPIFASKHISGLADQMFVEKSVWSPADVLTVEQVLLLHEFAECQQFNQVDRLAACHFLHALYSRSRWSDFRHVHEILIDFDANHVGYLEVRTRKHKTARNADKKSKLLPVVAPTLGIHPRPWSKTWVELRLLAGLPTSGVVDGPLFPAPDVLHPQQWTRRPLSANEASKWLQKVLESVQPGVQTSPTSHSLKSTTLSWCQKYGIDDKDQDVLGRHVQLKSQHVYGRELIAKPLRVYETVLRAVTEKSFQPDKTRSGYFDSRKEVVVEAEAEEENKEKEVPHQESQQVEILHDQRSQQDEVLSDKSSETGGSEDSSSQDSSSASDRGEDRPKKIDAQNQAGDQLFCHVKSRIVHKLSGNTFLCGRSNSSKYVMIDNRRSTYQVMCSKCFKVQHVSVTSADDN